MKSVVLKMQRSILFDPLLAALIVIISSWRYFGRAFADRGRSLVLDWADTPTLTKHMAADPWSQWFTGQWVGGTNFYRPFTSLAWGILFKRYGMHGLMQFDFVQAVSHVAGTVIAWLLVRELFGRWIGLATLAFFCFSAVERLGLPNVHYGLTSWIDTPEQWLLIGTFGSALAFVLAGRTGSKAAYYASLLLLIFGIGVKESAYVTPVMLLWVLWVQKKLSRDWRKTVPHFVITFLLIAYRLAIFHGHGMTYGSNRMWPVRFVTNAFGGQPLVEVIQGGLASLIVLAFCVFVGGVVHAISGKSLKTAGAALFAGLLFAAMLQCEARQLGIDAWLDAARYFTADKGEWAPPLIASAVPTFVIFAIWVDIFLRRSIVKWQAVCLVIILYSPMLVTASWMHALYCCGVAWALVLATIVVPMLGVPECAAIGFAGQLGRSTTGSTA
ncbi:MAG: hypothetical protein P4L33_07550 [Capsulimonadaceae bacterium]|nr:hypothetical protein [Capsulimonadaceae bacterium]